MRYHAFVQKGISLGRRKELTGGGLIRSMGGWTVVKSMRKAKMFEKSDERILGDGNFYRGSDWARVHGINWFFK